MHKSTGLKSSYRESSSDADFCTSRSTKIALKETLHKTALQEDFLKLFSRNWIKKKNTREKSTLEKDRVMVGSPKGT